MLQPSLGSHAERAVIPPPSHSTSRCESLDIFARWLPIHFLSPGPTNAWMGPAIRGMVLQALRDKLCLLNDRERGERRSQLPRTDDEHYCRGCLRMSRCDYGRVFEPDLLALTGRVERGMRDGLRGLTFAVNSPQPDYVSVGHSAVVRLLAVGQIAGKLLPLIVDALEELGSQVGIGPGRARFRVDFHRTQQDLWSLDGTLLPRASSRETLPWVKLVLESPLFMKLRCDAEEQTSGNGKFANGAGRKRDARRYDNQNAAPPDFGQFFAESMRTVSRAIREFGMRESIEDVSFGELKSAAQQVRCQPGTMDLQPFDQHRTSARQNSRWQPRGWYGSVVFRDVPLAFLPWLTWAGRLGVADSRNCGAGLWHVVIA